MADFNDIKTALYDMVNTMTIANGYNFNWANHRVTYTAHPELAVLTIRTESEENTDKNAYTGTNQYRQTRNIIFSVRVISDLGIVNFDEIIDNSETKLEIAKKDVLKRYNSTYNIAGDAGAISLMYQGMEYEDDANADIFAPVKMNMKFTVKYIEDRQVN